MPARVDRDRMRLGQWRSPIFAYGAFVLVCLATGLLVSVSASLFLLILIPAVFGIAAIVIVSVIRLGVAVAKSDWQRCATWASWLLLMGVAFPLNYAGEFLGYEVRLLLNKPDYDAEVTQLHRQHEPVFRLWKWNAYLIFQTIWLAYDETDGLGLPPGRQSVAWTEVAEQNAETPLDRGGWWAHHLRGHYYILVTS